MLLARFVIDGKPFVAPFLTNTLEDVIFPNPVVEGMNVEIMVPLGRGEKITFRGKATNLTNSAQHYCERLEEGLTTFDLRHVAGQKEFDELKESLKIYRFDYSEGQEFR